MECYSLTCVILVAIVWPLVFTFLCLAFLAGMFCERRRWAARTRYLLSEIERHRAEKAAQAAARAANRRKKCEVKV